jgi:hypothetical protein
MPGVTVLADGMTEPVMRAGEWTDRPRLSGVTRRCGTAWRYNDGVDGAGPLTDALTPEQQEWLRHSEALWRRAHHLAAQHPEHDVSDFYHALRNLERTPSERLRLGLNRARLRPHRP